MRVVFLGTPDFAVGALESIISSRHEVVAVVTQPDKPVGRKAILTPSAVKVCAQNHGISVLQFDRVSQHVEELSKLNADIMVTCAFGQILSKQLLDLTKHGVINVHASLLPKYRGASPIQHAILSGDSKTGVTIMKTEVSLDSGDIILARELDILPEETCSELFDRLSVLGAQLIVEALDKIEDNTATFTPQNHQLATFVKQIKKADAEIDFAKEGKVLKDFVRAMQTWPCAFTYLGDKLLKIHKIDYVTTGVNNPPDKCGIVVSADRAEGLKVSCADGEIEILQLQIEGGKRMNSADFLLGRKIVVGERLGKC